MAPRVSKSGVMLCHSPDSQTAAGSEAAETQQGKPPDKENLATHCYLSQDS